VELGVVRIGLYPAGSVTKAVAGGSVMEAVGKDSMAEVVEAVLTGSVEVTAAACR